MISIAKVLLHSLAPDCAALVKVDLRNVAGSQTVDCIGELFAQTFVLDVADGVEVGLEREDEGFGVRKAMECLAYAAHKCLNA